MQVGDVVMVFEGKSSGYCEVVGVSAKRIQVKSKFMNRPTHISSKNYIKMVGENLQKLLEQGYV
jgi:hypothetical protein